MYDISVEKLEWLRSKGVIDIKRYDYMIPNNGHLFTLDYLSSNTLEQTLKSYELTYSKR